MPVRAIATIPICCLLVLIGGCVDQQKEIAAYRTVLDENVPPSTDSPAQSPLSMIDALRAANQANEQLAIEGENYLQALIDRKRASAAFLPTISLSPTYFVRDASGGGNARDQSGGVRDRRLDVPVTGNINLFNGFSDVANVRATAATAEQRRALLLDLRQSLLIDVARAYFQILRSEQSVEVLKNSIAVQEERVADIRARREAGFARQLEVSQTEAQASAARVTLVDAQNDVKRGRELLALLTALPIGNRALVDEVEPSPATLPIESIESTALDRREDLQAASAGIEAARRNVEAALGQYWPAVSLNASYFLSRQSAPTDSEWATILTANLPIFSAGLIEADVRDAWSRLRQAKLNESFIHRQVILDARVAHEDFLSSNRRLDELKVQVAAAQEALAQADDQYRAGLGTNLERIVAQQQLLSAQLQYTSERYDNRIFQLALERAMGSIDDVIR